MRDLTEVEEKIIHYRRKEFAGFVSESVPVLIHFLSCLGMLNPEEVKNNAERFVVPLDLWMKEQPILEEDRIWILTRMGYFIGEYLNQRYGGVWMLEEDVDSPYFSQYVVGEFKNLPILNSRVSPFSLANNYVGEPPGRSLVNKLEFVREELVKIALGDKS